MFVWTSSSNRQPGIGCCGGMFLLLPLCLFMSASGSSSNSFILLVLLAVMAVMFIIPRITQVRHVSVPNRDVIITDSMTEKRKHDDIVDAEYADYTDKPKRLGDGYMLTDDGEIIPSDDDINRHGNFSGGV